MNRVANRRETDAQLLRQEAEAWNELVNEYHDREAAILAGADPMPIEHVTLWEADGRVLAEPLAALRTQGFYLQLPPKLEPRLVPGG